MDLNSRSSTLILDDVCVKKTHLPDHWTICVHPQGWIYFYSSLLKVVTDQDIRDETVYEILARNVMKYPLADLDEQMEIQLHVQTHLGSEGVAAFTLAINHKHCVASYHYHEVKGENVPTFDPNTLNRHRRLYWNYLWNHPAHVPTPARAIPDASDALIWYYTDNLISGSKCLAPFSKPECEDLSKVVREMSDPCNSASISKTAFLAWLLREICSFRDSESYGQFTYKAAHTLRESRTLPPNSGSRRPPQLLLSAINLIINIFFFGIPHTYYAHVKLASEFRGRLSNVQQTWEKYIERLVREYSHFLLISTVLLSATVGLLAVPEIAEPARVAATVSALTSLGSIIVGVFSIWRHQTNTRTADSFTYMYNAQHNYLGFHGHAMLLSLPPVLLVWAIVTFTISIVAYALQGLTDIDSLHPASAWTVLSVFVILTVTVIAALYTFSIIWKFQRKRWKFYHWKSLLTRRRSRLLPQGD